jgi:hypothetical protein
VVKIKGATLPPGYNEDVGVLFGSAPAAKLYPECTAVAPANPVGTSTVKITVNKASVTTSYTYE